MRAPAIFMPARARLLVSLLSFLRKWAARSAERRWQVRNSESCKQCRKGMYQPQAGQQSAGAEGSVQYKIWFYISFRLQRLRGCQI